MEANIGLFIGQRWRDPRAQSKLYKRRIMGLLLRDRIYCGAPLRIYLGRNIVKYHITSESCLLNKITQYNNPLKFMEVKTSLNFLRCFPSKVMNRF